MGLLLMSCAQIIETRAYLREANILVPVNQPPMQPIDTSMAGKIIISPGFSFNPTKSISGEVESLGSSSEKKVIRNQSESGLSVNSFNNTASALYIEPGDLTWKFPQFSTRMDFDFIASKFLVIPFGIDLSVGDNESLYGFNAGLGFYTTDKSTTIRFDAGVVFQSTSFETRITVIQTYDPFIGSTQTDTFYLFGKDKSTYLNPYIGLTINSAREANVVDYFLNISYFAQNLLNYDAFKHDPNYPYWDYYDRYQRTKFDITAGIINVFPGITMKLRDNLRLLGGVRMLFVTEIIDNSKSFFAVPVLKLNLML
jgi:hypothetical protein